jgi:hypothetical protein
MSLVTTLFEIQDKILAVMPDEYTLVDSGMFIPTGKETVHWRDATIEVPADEYEYCFSYSSDGDVKGEVPPKMVLSLNTILNGYKK